MSDTPFYFSLITLFPNILQALKIGITGRAIDKGLIQIDAINPRDFSLDKHRSVDDKPYGGGPGMVMCYQPLRDAIKQAKRQLGDNTCVIYLSPQGKKLTQKHFEGLSSRKKLILLAGRYEGIDERIIKKYVDVEYSIGDYVLSGGEYPALVLIDGITRLLPGALNNNESAPSDSFANRSQQLSAPCYTRPHEIDGMSVPAVLMSGDHNAIKQWHESISLEQTKRKRPDLLHYIWDGEESGC